MLKKVFMYFIVLILIVSNTGCANTQNVAEVSAEYSDEDIYNAFLEAYDFYYLWVYGQYYIDWDTSVVKDGGFIAQVVHDEIKTAEQLTEEIQSYFVETKANEYINQLKPYDENGKLYISHVGGVGDNGVEFDTYSVEKVDDDKYILTLNLKENEFMEAGVSAKVVCMVKDNKLLFENYTSTPTETDYVLF